MIHDTFVKLYLFIKEDAMKAIRKIGAFAMAVMMLLSTVLLAGADIQTVKAADKSVTIRLHYYRPDGDYTSWNVWSWPKGKDGAAYNFTEEAEHDGKTWKVATIDVAVGTENIGYIIRKGEWESKDYDGDQFLDTIDYVSGTVNFYVTSGQKGGEIDDTNTVKGCVITDSALSTTDAKTINVTFNMKPEEAKVNAIKVVDSNNNDMAIDKITPSEDGLSAVITLKDEINEREACINNISYSISFDEMSYAVTLPDYYSTEAFEKDYTYNGEDLGSTWTKDATTFKVWAPTAKSVKVNLYNDGEVKYDNSGDKKVEIKETPAKQIDMTLGEKGVWTAEESGDLNGKFYTYEVAFNDGTVNEACDPYARAVGVNGDRAMVVDLASTNPDGWDTDQNPYKGKDMNYTDFSVWEAHVRDFSYSEDSGVSIQNRGKYLAFTEHGTKNKTGQSTCLDYLKELGVTHVQLNPVYDYATVDETALDKDQFNWGYDPKNYNAPEGSYSSNPYDGAVRIKEFKQMVQSLHNDGIGVIMDVVYNHTNSSDYCYNRIVPSFFHRPGSNGSGCGNDVASERKMVSNFIVDSVLYWHNEYHIDGFRFDLVGLTDTNTINEICERLHAEDPSIILYGEGWTMSTLVTKKDVELTNQGNASDVPTFGFFNDAVRDYLKGSVFNAQEKGYVNGALGKVGDIFSCVKAAPSWNGYDSSPIQMINYSSCHDNLTLWDKINSSNYSDTFDDKVKQNNLAAAITITSQGVPFILAGEEILRTKVKEVGPDGIPVFDHNSYASPSSENCIKWDTLGNEKYQKVLDYYKGLFAFRNSHKALRMADGRDVQACIKQIDTTYLDVDADHDFVNEFGGILEYSISGYENEDDIVVIYNPNTKAADVKIPDGAWNVYVQGDKAGTEVLDTVSGTAKVDAISATVLVKGQATDITKTAKVSGIKNVKYTGKAIKFSSLKVTNNGKTLKNGKDYTVSYASNKNAGTAKVTINFKGLYSGKITKTFKIAKAAQSISATNKTVKSTVKKVALKAKRTKGDGKLTYKSSNTKIAKVDSKGNVILTGKKGKVKVTITAASTKNFNKATKTITVTVK